VPHRTPFQSAHVRSAWLVSLQSAIWTVTTSVVAIALGVTSNSAVLGAFGAIGFVDALGSVTLTYHFRHALRRDALSERLESVAHRVVVVGLFVVGLGAAAVGVARLVAGSPGGSSGAGTTLAAISLVALVGLSARKRVLARHVGSAALLADGRLSAVGAMQAGVTLFGTAAARWLDWNWADASAASIVGLVAIAVAVVTWGVSNSLRRRARAVGPGNPRHIGP
jgi:divalent metal cation (Fe/Co/Zn/Cd) transporter